MSERVSDREIEFLIAHNGAMIGRALTELLERREAERWRPIEGHPKKGRVWACIWHGDRYAVVIANCFPTGIHDERDGSCVGWHASHKPKRPAYWMPFDFPTPPDPGQ